MTDQELQRKVNFLDVTVDNANNYALSLERRIMDLEKHNRNFLTMYIAGVMTLIFAVAAVILLA
jgi:hypothetical protein